VQESLSRTRPNPRAALAALLSFVFPGVGQAYNGERRLAWVLAIPAILLIVLGVLVVSIARNAVLVRLLDARFLIGLIVLDVAFLAWRVIAIVQAYVRRERPNWRRWTTYAAAGVLLLTLAMHAVPAFYLGKALDTLQSVALGGGGGNSELHNSFGGVGVEVPLPSDRPDVSAGERINILLVGIDWRPGRTEHLTDTMLVVSLNPKTGQTAMISIPRDLYGAILPDGRAYNAKLNSLLIRATIDKATYPLGGVPTLKATVGRLLGVNIHYFAAINLIGFKQAVDAIGGVTINVTRAISDPTYNDEFGNKVGYFIGPGLHPMNGHQALAYVRSRKGIGDNDFTRAARQQQLLAAVRAKLTAGNLLTALPGLLDAVKTTISTDVPTDQISVLAQAVQDANVANLQRAVIQPPLVHSATGPGGAYILVPDFAAILELGQRLMGDGVAALPSATPTP
jgi:LCP family protein required for cell wall assembly